jgi:hypothetical protein
MPIMSCIGNAEKMIPRSRARKGRLGRIARLGSLAAAIALLLGQGLTAGEKEGRFIPRLLISSTIPSNGDLNPYGIAFVPPGFPEGGPLHPGDVLVSNFNGSANLQGTGTTIIQFTPRDKVAPAGQASLFFEGAPPLGLTLALGVLQRGFVLVGSVTTTDGTSKTVKAGPLLIVDRNGKQISSIPSDSQTKLDGPWGLTIADGFSTAKVFVSNVLDGTVTRLDLSVGATSVSVIRSTRVASGYAHRTDPAALVLGPAGLVYDSRDDALYVASTADNAVFKVPYAGSASQSVGKGKIIFQDVHLRGPVALAFAPNGHLLTSNGDAVNPDPTQPSEIVEFTKKGEFIGQYDVNEAQGAAFGIATKRSDDDTGLLATVNDTSNDMAVEKLNVEDRFP